MLQAGHAENALPQTARATVNCRIMPDESVEEVGRTLARVIGDEKIAIIPKGTAVLSPPSADQSRGHADDRPYQPSRCGRAFR